MKVLLCGGFLALVVVEGFILSPHKAIRNSPHLPQRSLYINKPLQYLPDGYLRQTPDDRSWESDHVARVRQSLSLDDVKLALKSSVAHSDNGQNLGFVEKVSPNVAAAALRRISQLGRRQDPSGQGQCELQDGSLIWPLVNRLGDTLSLVEENHGLTPFALVDAIIALSTLKRKLEFGELLPISTAEDGDKTLNDLATTLINLVDKNREKTLRALIPSRMVDVLYALHVLGVRNMNPETEASEDNKQPFSAAARIQTEICKKLSGGRRLAALSIGDMSIALTTIAASLEPLDPDESTLAIILMRRFRKQKIRQAATSMQLMQAIRAATRIGVVAKDLSEGNDDDFMNLFKESRVMVFTVFKEFLKKHSVGGERLESHEADNGAAIPNALNLRQIGKILDCLAAMAVFKDQKDGGDAALRSLWESFLHAACYQALTKASIDEIAEFIQSVEATQSSDLALSPQFMSNLGDDFQRKVLETLRVKEDAEETTPDVNPRSIDIILRYAALSHNNQTTLEAFLVCAQELFTNHFFLSSCGVTDLTNYVTFLEKTRFYGNDHPTSSSSWDQDPLLTLAERIMDDDVVDEMSATQASRILAAYTMVVAERSHGSEPSEAQMTTTRALFHAAGEHLLTRDSIEMSTRDISSVLWAYAKASYTEDLGIFDHLAALLAARVEDCSVRQVAKSLWACGKMTLWESKQQGLSYVGDIDQQEYGQAPLLPPPYLPSANQYADFLSRNVDDMSSKDVAQAVWAMARLQSVQVEGDNEPDVRIDRFLWKASQLAPLLTTHEVASILWGMSQTGYSDCGPIVQSFTDRLLHLHETLPHTKCSPHEAAVVMMALGRMKIQDIKLFQVLSDDMLDQLHDASAHCIANALWAHRAVEIAPPRQLLDRWASERLGLIAVQPRRNT